MRRGGGWRRRLEYPGLDDASHECSDPLKRGSVNDVGGPVLEMIDAWGVLG